MRSASRVPSRSVRMHHEFPAEQGHRENHGRHRGRQRLGLRVRSVTGGCKRTICMRPANESARRGSSRTLVEPAKRNRPGVRRRSTSSFKAPKSSGTCCTSSRDDPFGQIGDETHGIRIRRRADYGVIEAEILGSRAYAARPSQLSDLPVSAGSGGVDRVVGAHTICASVVLPHWRGP